jgi:hypothetical protein
VFEVLDLFPTIYIITDPEEDVQTKIKIFMKSKMREINI